ncbi:hypothetical protein N7478_003890 [Penicillium angulare]|uniref:uncharacterized protein n=1 Tax=Penicillium angulare TaxID=116970 RepID=UPI002540584E|nr:uncharacterized protein N7478_003890 [Penicillium angulare]KAJ5288204.1 hypothetical protein N7478_003890 [Penicillium angulare]
MTSTKNPDGPEDVNDFLMRIRELGERRDKEDDERTKRLENEILQGRKERQARRADPALCCHDGPPLEKMLADPRRLPERARSIAGSPTLNPARLSASSSIGQPSIDPPEHLEPTVQTPVPESTEDRKPSIDTEALYRADSRRGSLQDTELESPRTLPPLSRSRAGTLSWQQRPSSRDSWNLGNRSPGSTSPTRSSHLRNASTAENDNQMSRSSIALSLGSKDPSWFRQTPDRGFGSPAYRKPEERSDSQVDLGTSRQLPGMSRESTVEPEKIEKPEEKTPSPPPSASTVGETNASNRYSSVSSISPPTGLGSPVQATDGPKLEPSHIESSVDEPMLPPSPTQRRMSPERTRSTSPTKGLGGFVQSAMMRRSDSVSKRWSAQIPQGLSRSNSIVSNRNSVAAPSLTASVSDMTPTTSSRANRDISPMPTERPGSSYSEASVQPSETTERPKTPSFTGNNDGMRSEGSPTRPSWYGHTRSTSSITAESPAGDAPSSPFTSRTMDPKRWSPTKASWLESALNRPDTRQQKPPPPQQPSWAQARQSRGSVDMGRVSAFKEVTPVGLMRTPPPGGHFKKPSISGTSSALGSPTAPKRTTLLDMAPPVTESERPSTNTTSEKAPEPEPQPDLEAGYKSEPEPETEAEPEPEPVLDIKPPLEPESQPEPEVQPELPEVENLEEDLEPLAVPEAETQKSPSKPSLSLDLKKSPETDSIRKPSVLSPKPNFSLPKREPLPPKPLTQSPVVDFRGNLRKRDTGQDKGKQAEPEFKNVFGKLKKTETRNYVAPDELKSNILRGKSALNVTGGPKKTERVDEFRESLVGTKAAMKAGGGSIRRNTAGEKDAPQKPVEGVPEAIAKRNIMTKTNSVRRTNTDLTSPTTAAEPSPSRFSYQSPVSPIAPEEQLSLRSPTKPALTELEIEETQPESNLSPMTDRRDALEISSPVSETEQKPSSEQFNSARSSPMPKVAETASIVTASPVVATKGKLAGRINPALAGILSRGPLGASEAPKRELPTPPSGDASSASPTAPLTHMTKSRARGPKRRAPKGASAPLSPAEDIKEVGAISSPEVKSSQIIPEPVASPESTLGNESKERVFQDTETAQTGSPYIKTLQGVKTSFQNALNGGLQQRLRSMSPTSPKEPSSPSSQTDANSPQEMRFPRDLKRSSGPPVPPKPSASPSPSPSPSSPTSRYQWGQARFIASSPSPLGSRFKESRSASPSTPSKQGIPGVLVADSSPQSKNNASPPVPPKRADISLQRPVDPRNRLSRKMSAPSLVAQAAEAREVISGFFKNFPNPRDRMDIDPQLMLANKQEDPKIRTAKRQIWEITGDGKRQELPVNQEYVLYEGSMYVCVHLFEVQGTNHSEVYLWCGDDVPEAALDDAQLFARKVAREHSCKLEVIRQGKERLRFIQALGGIIITRRGSSSRSTSSALYMLCGRKHLGQMAFDEVDYSLRNLCSGFPFVISAPFGKLYLWKGKGSGPEETGAARLISMDLGLTGEFEEVDEGAEPECFFDDFAGSNETNALLTSEYWALKPKYDHFRTRLLRVDHELGQPPRFWMRRPGSGSPTVRPNDCVQEIEPFCYRDITDKDVYVLDTFFEIYVIIGEQASQKSADFASAVVLAHEYGILAASLQDRPFIPKSFVALGGIPDRCQSAFRKWDQSSLHAPCIFPLDVAIEAIRSQ